MVLAVGFMWAVEVGSPRTVDATGVDGIVVPLVDVDSVEFVDGIDHPWLPFRRGASWEYRGQGGLTEMTSRTEVLADTVDVAGVEATRVRTNVDGADVVRWYAQDVDGHVWLLGEEGVWSVADGAPAGLAMPAEPRRGDGFVRVPAFTSGGEPEEWWTIGERDADVTVGEESYAEVLAVSGTRTAGGARTSYELEFAEGVGLVRRTDARGVLELVEHSAG